MNPHTKPLETAAHPETLKRIVIEPLSRVEGHGNGAIVVGDFERTPMGNDSGAGGTLDSATVAAVPV